MATRKAATDSTYLSKLLRNPFTFLEHENSKGKRCHPFDDPDFDKVAALRTWRVLKPEILDHWRKHYPGHTHWMFEIERETSRK